MLLQESAPPSVTTLAPMLHSPAAMAFSSMSEERRVSFNEHLWDGDLTYSCTSRRCPSQLGGQLTGEVLICNAADSVCSNNLPIQITSFQILKIIL